MLLLGCASSIDVEVGEGVDLAAYTSWDWLPRDAIVVEAPFEDEAELEGVLARAVERELAARGLMRDRSSAELWLGVVFVAVRGTESFTRAGAVETLTSHHDNTYEVQSVQVVERVVDRCRVELVVRDARWRRVIWRGSLRDRATGGCGPELPDAVAALAERFRATRR
jgi:hypothetical protein